jgi:hypothetical protein
MDFNLTKIRARESGQLFLSCPRFVQPPPLFAFKLKNEDLNVVIMWSETLGTRRGQIHVGSHHAAQVLLKRSADLPHGFVESLWIEKPEAATVVVEVPDN